MDFCAPASDEQFFDCATPSRHDLLRCGPPCNASMGPEASACSVLGHMGPAHHRGLQRACEGYIPSTSHICTAVYRAIWVDVVYNSSTFLFCNVKWRNHEGRRTGKHERAHLFQHRRIIVVSTIEGETVYKPNGKKWKKIRTLIAILVFASKILVLCFTGGFVDCFTGKELDIIGYTGPMADFISKGVVSWPLSGAWFANRTMSKSAPTKRTSALLRVE